jgi:ribose transport system substrate-binding protein
MSRDTILAWLAVLSLLLTGCSGSGGKKYNVIVIPKGRTHEFWLSIQRGAERAAADLTAKGTSVGIQFEGPHREDEAKPQINIVDYAIGRRVSGIVLAPQHRKNMVEVVDRAVKAGIPVVIIDSGLEDNEAKDRFVQYVATDNYNGGKLAAKRLIASLAEKGKKAPRIVLFRYQVGSESTEQREQGFIDEVERVIAEQKGKGEPTITWVSKGDVFLGATKDTALNNARPYLADKADQIDGIFAPNESSANGVLEALRGLKKNKTITLVGFDSSEPLLSALRAGDIDGLIVQDPYRMGYLGVWVLVQHLEGKKLDNPDKYLPTGEHLVTMENLEDRTTQQLFSEEIQRQRTIETPKLK